MNSGFQNICKKIYAKRWTTKKLWFGLFILIQSLPLFQTSWAQDTKYPSDYNSLSPTNKTWLDRSCTSARALDFSNYKQCVDRELPAIKNGLGHDLSELTSGQSRWLERGCADSRSLGFSSYKRCVDRELPTIKKGMGLDLSKLTSGQRRWLDRSCVNARILDFTSYKQCISRGLTSFENSFDYDLSRLNSAQSRRLEQSCARNLDFTSYKRCVGLELPTIKSGLGYDLAELNSSQKRWLEQSCANSKKVSFSNYKRCVDRELPEIESGLGYNLSELTAEQGSWLERFCANSRSLGFSSYKRCVGRKLLEITSIQKVDTASSTKESTAIIGRNLDSLRRSTTSSNDKLGGKVLPLSILLLFFILGWAFFKNLTAPKPADFDETKSKNGQNNESRYFYSKANRNDRGQQVLGLQLLKLYAKLYRAGGISDVTKIHMMKQIINTSGITNASKIFTDAVNSNQNYEIIARLINKTIEADRTIANKVTAKLLILKHLGNIMVADGNIGVKETQFYIKTAKIFGFEQFSIDAFLQKLRSRAGTENKSKRQNTIYQNKIKLALEILEIDNNYTIDELKIARLKKVKELHPDVLISQDLPKDIIFKRENLLKSVNVAYDLLNKQKT